jgi:hypothetical protein
LELIKGINSKALRPQKKEKRKLGGFDSSIKDFVKAGGLDCRRSNRCHRHRPDDHLGALPIDFGGNAPASFAARPGSDVGESNHYLMKPWRRDFITQRRKLGVHSHPVRRLFFPFHCVTTAFQHSLSALIGLYFVEITLRGTTRNQLQNNYRGPE